MFRATRTIVASAVFSVVALLAMTASAFAMPASDPHTAATSPLAPVHTVATHSSGGGVSVWLIVAALIVGLASVATVASVRHARGQLANG